MAQKVGEESVETALAAVVLYHLTLLLKVRELSLSDVTKEPEQRHKAMA